MSARTTVTAHIVICVALCAAVSLLGVAFSWSQAVAVASVFGLAAYLDTHGANR